MAHDQLTIGIVQFPSTLNPDLEAVAAKSYVLGFALRPFTVFDADWKIVCLLCTELPSFENGRAVKTELPGGKTGIDLTYTIRDGAMWADGVPVTTDDVKFTYEFGRDKDSAVANAQMYREILGVDVKDDKTFTLHFDRLGYNFAAIDDFVLLPAHLERATFADPAQYRLRTLYATDPTNPGLYDGPYRISEFVSGSHIALEPNPHWAGPAPYFKRITVRVIENTAALEANLLSGTVDMVAGEVGLPLDEALAFDKRHGGDFQYRSTSRASPSNTWIAISTTRCSPICACARSAVVGARPRDPIAHSVCREAGGCEQLCQSRKMRGSPTTCRTIPTTRRAPSNCSRKPAGTHSPTGRAGTPTVRPCRWSWRQPPATDRASWSSRVLCAKAQWKAIRRRYPYPQRAGARAVRRDFAASPFRLGDVCLDQRPGKFAALDLSLERGAERGERLCRREFERLPEPGDGPHHRRARNRARPGQAKNIVGRGTAARCDRPPLAAALFPLGCVHPAEMADRRPPDRQPVSHNAVGLPIGARRS